jgi:hypothetical protein
MEIWTIACSSSINLSWFLLIYELGFIGDANSSSTWLSLSSSGMAESCSSLFVSNMLAVLMVKERTPLVFAWKLQLQWLRGVFCVIMVVHGLMRHHRQTIDQECMPWCGGIPSSWSLLPTYEMVSLRVMKTCINWLIWGELLPASHQPPSLSPRKAQC